MACRRLDWDKAVNYLERIRSTTISRRFGWLCDHVGADIPENMRARILQLAAGGSTTFLGPRKPKQHVIGYQKSWKLAVNVGKEELSESAGLAKRQTFKRET
jgi:predicted transcriptional regulator of viral defense system